MRQGYPNLFSIVFLKPLLGYFAKLKTKNWDIVGASRYGGPNMDKQHPRVIVQVAITQCANKIPFSYLFQMKDLQGLKHFQLQSWWDIVGARK